MVPGQSLSANSISSTDLQGLRSRVRGPILVPGDAGYDAARRVWNDMIDRRPAAIARVTGAADVVQCVRFAREREIPLAVRGGGHSIAGNAICDEGLVVDFSGLRAVRVDARRGIARVEPGATLGDLDHETHAFGYALSVGINSTTGVAGLALGGGFGWISRKLGLTCDSLVSADVVTATGDVLRASAEENPDLFWGLRGGGGNFGIVTSFEFKLHPIPPQIYAGLIVFPHAQGKAVLERYREFTKSAPEDLTVWVIMRQAPPLPFLPAEVHGKNILAVAVCYVGDAEQGKRAIAPVYKFGAPLGDHVGPQPLAAWQQAFDPMLGPGARNYWKSHNFTDLSDGLFDALLEHAANLPTPECDVFLGHLGGQVNRVAPDATAYAHRDVNYILNVHGRWTDAALDEKGIAWTRGLFKAAAPFATKSVYVNFLTQDEADRVQGAYGPNYARMARIKEKYDPANLFRANQNVKPAS